MMPYGVNSAEEALSGVAPNASTETCDISDFMHSNTWLLRQTGNASYGDRLERAFHNAAPAAVSRSYMEHVCLLRPISAAVGQSMSKDLNRIGRPVLVSLVLTPRLIGAGTISPLICGKCHRESMGKASKSTRSV